jgi:hypothetical protein
MNPCKYVTCVLALTLPASLIAADSAAAILYSSGTAWINGASVPKSSAVFVGDLVQTRSDSVANIKAAGSEVSVLPDSLVQLQSDAIKLEHGTVSVATSKGMAAEVGTLKIRPATGVWTIFQVTDTDTTVHIFARKGDLALSDGTTLPQGQETTRQETSKRKRRGAAMPAGGTGIFNSQTAMVVSVIAIGGVTTWVLTRSDDPLSPSSPARNGP